MVDALDQFAVTSEKLADHLEVVSEEDLAAMKRLWHEANNLLELLSDEESMAIRFEVEGLQLKETLEEVHSILWPK